MDPKHQEDEYGNQGERLFVEGKYLEASVCFEQAWTIARRRQDGAAESIWLANMGTAYLACRRPSDARMCFEAGLQLARVVGRDIDEMHFHRDLVAALSEDGQLDAADKHAHKGLEIAQRIGDKKEEHLLWGYLGNAYSIAGRYDKAQEQYERAVRIATEAQDGAGVGLWTGNLGNNLLGRGEYEAAVDHFRRALTLSEGAGDRPNTEKWHAGLQRASSLLALQDDPKRMARKTYEEARKANESAAPERAIANWLEAAKWCRLARDYRHCGDGLCNAGVLLNRLGKYTEADNRFAEAIDVYTLADDQARVGMAYVNQGVSFRDRGSPDKAGESLVNAITILRAAHAPSMLANALITFSDIRGAQAHPTEASALAQEASELYRQVGDKLNLAKALLRLGTLTIGSTPDQAESLLRESAVISREVDDFATTAVALITLSTFLADSGHPDAAIRELQASKEQIVAHGLGDVAFEYLFLLASLFKSHSRLNDALDIWHEVLELAENQRAPVTAARALGEISTAFASRLRHVRSVMRARVQQGLESRQNSPSAPSEAKVIHIETEDDAIALLTALNRAQSNDQRLRLIHAHSEEVDGIFFASLTFNVRRYIERGEHEEANAIVDVARMFTQVQQQSLRILSTLSTQLLDQDQTNIIHLEPGSHVKFRPGDDDYNRRAADVLAEDGLRLAATQQSRPAYARFKNELQFRENAGDGQSLIRCLTARV